MFKRKESVLISEICGCFSSELRVRCSEISLRFKAESKDVFFLGFEKESVLISEIYDQSSRL